MLYAETGNQTGLTKIHHRRKGMESMGSIIIMALVGVAVIGTVMVYNNLITLRNRSKNAFAQIDVQLTRRYDLIPNLVETAKAYMTHERETLTAVITARNQAASSLRAVAAKPGDLVAMQGLTMAEQGLSGLLGRFMALAENYPDLKASDNMKQLSEELSSTENRVAFARQSYNDNVMEYNIGRERFPASMIAGFFRFPEAALLEIDEREKRQAPHVSFT
jgi:LemA protein